jgi:hypothetical protein
MSGRSLAAVLVLLGLPWAAVAQPPPAGGEFQVNTYTTNYQRDAAVAGDRAGNCTARRIPSPAVRWRSSSPRQSG